MEGEPSELSEAAVWGSIFQKIKTEIINRADEMFSAIVNFAAPEVLVNYKGIVLEDIEDPKFRSMLRIAMDKARVDQATLDKLFETGDAVAAQGAFEKH